MESQRAVFAQARRAEREFDHLMLIIEHIEEAPTAHPDQAALAASVAKRARRECTLLVRAIAAYRDQLQTPEVTS